MQGTYILLLFHTLFLFNLEINAQVKSDSLTTLINTFGIKLRLIPSGTYLMGGERENELPVHKVTITKPFFIGVYEITKAQYQKVMSTSISECADSNLPVGVTWLEAVAFCNRLSELTGSIYRLPTEAEWEYAARGGFALKKFVWGDHNIPEKDGIKYANVPDETVKKSYPSLNIIEGYDDGYEGLSPVGSFAPNGYGLYDMAGNAWERCSDYYDENYYEYSGIIDPKGPETGGKRVLRGGGCWYNPDGLRVGARSSSPIDRCGSNDGLRVVLELQDKI